MKRILFFIPLILLLACNNDDSPDSDPITPIPTGAGLVLVANEGGFNQGNASLTVFDPASGALAQKVFSKRNGNAPLGDVFQSISSFGNSLFLVVNNSQKIEVVSQENYTRMRTIEGLTSPRYMQVVGAERGYITDLFAGGIHKINPVNGDYEGMIPAAEWLEQLLMVNGQVWATAPGGSDVYFIDPSTDQIDGGISLTAGPNHMVIDADGYVWVLCQGDFNVEYPVLHRIDALTHMVEYSLEFGNVYGFGGALAISPSGEMLYVLIGGDVYALPISGTALPDTPLIPANGRNLYRLSVSPYTGDICVTDARDFSSNGEATIYNSTGTEIHRFATGVAPGFVFWKE